MAPFSKTFLKPHSLMAFTGVKNAYGPSPQPTACRTPFWSLKQQQEVTRPKARFKSSLPKKTKLDGGANQVPTYLGQLLQILPKNWVIWGKKLPSNALKSCQNYDNLPNLVTIAVALSLMYKRFHWVSICLWRDIFYSVQKTV